MRMQTLLIRMTVRVCVSRCIRCAGLHDFSVTFQIHKLISGRAGISDWKPLNIKWSS